MSSRGMTSVAVVLILLVVGQAGAGILGTALIKKTGHFTDGTITIAGVRNVTAYGGIYLLHKSGGTGDGALLPDGEVKSVCIDLMQNSTGGLQLYNVVMPPEAPVPGTAMGAVRAALLEELWGRYFHTQAELDAKKAEAFSAAVWEIVFESDPTFDVTVGTGFRCSGLASGMAALANGWLASLDGTGPMADLRALTNETYQDYLVEVPEPATACLLALGGLAVLRRRRK